jgi:uncharacterized SAM-binding protein YcdF (DUF218 family)
MYFTVKALLRSLLLPPASILLLALFGAVLLWRGRRLGAVFVSVALISLWLLSTPIIAEAVEHLAVRCPPLDLSKPVKAQAVVIIGGGEHRDFAPEYQGPAAMAGLLDRLAYGAFVARRTGLPILISGAPEEAHAMEVSLQRDFGTATRWVDNRSGDTFENARLSARILRPLGITHIILITSATHMWRAAHEFEDAGFDVVPGPEGEMSVRHDGVFRFVPSPSALWRSNLSIYELIGEPMRELQEALGVRERFDRKMAGN